MCVSATAMLCQFVLPLCTDKKLQNTLTSFLLLAVFLFHGSTRGITAFLQSL